MPAPLQDSILQIYTRLFEAPIPSASKRHFFKIMSSFTKMADKYGAALKKHEKSLARTDLGTGPRQDLPENTLLGVKRKLLTRSKERLLPGVYSSN